MKHFASILVLNYNGEKILNDTVDSLINLEYPKENFEIIIIDNNSQDKSKLIIDEYSNKFPNFIRSLKLNKNLGFAGGNNKAINIAKGDFVLLLNNDCIVDQAWLKQIIKTADSDDNIFSVTSKLMRYPKSLNQIQNAGSLVFDDGYGRDIGAIVTKEHRQLYEIDTNQFSSDCQIYSSCGAAVLYKKSILDKIGLLDDTFFMYYEDTEISERAMLAGYKNYFSARAIVYHHHSASSVEWSPFFIFNVEIGRLIHLTYHFPIRIIFKEFTKYNYKALLRLIYSLIKKPSEIRKSLAYMKVSLIFAFLFPKYFLHRFKLNKIYQPNARELNFQKILSGFWYFN